MNSSSSSSSGDVFIHPRLSAMPVIVQMSHLVVELDPWILRLLPLPLSVALWCPSTSRVENMHPSITSISISMMFTLSSSFHSSVWIPSYLHLPSLAPVSQHDVSITAEAVDLLLLPGVNPQTGPFQGHPIIPKTFLSAYVKKKWKEKHCPWYKWKFSTNTYIQINEKVN